MRSLAIPALAPPEAGESIERIRTGDHCTATDVNGKGIGGLGYIIVHGIMDLLGGASRWL